MHTLNKQYRISTEDHSAIGNNQIFFVKFVKTVVYLWVLFKASYSGLIDETEAGKDSYCILYLLANFRI